LTPPPTLKQGSTHRSVLLLSFSPFSAFLSLSLSRARARACLILFRPVSLSLPRSPLTPPRRHRRWRFLSLRAVQIKFSSTVKQCRYPTRNNPHREFPSLFRSSLSPRLIPALSRRASRIPLVSGRTDRTRIDRINYSLLTIIAQAG